MKSEKLEEFRKGASIFLIGTVLAGIMVGCKVKAQVVDNEITTSVSDETVAQPIKVEDSHTVYVYSYPTFMSDVAFASKIGEKKALARNDELFMDAYSAMEHKNALKLTENTIVKPEQKVIVSGVAYIDADGNINQTYKKDTIISELPYGYNGQGKPLGVSYQIAKENGDVLGWVSYIDDSLNLVQERIIETSDKNEVPDGYTYVDEYESPNEIHFNGKCKSVQEYYLK